LTRARSARDTCKRADGSAAARHSAAAGHSADGSAGAEDAAGGSAGVAGGSAGVAGGSAGAQHAARGGSERLLGIGAAAQRLGVSERALRYYQQIGLIVPASTTPGGLRRYSESDVARVERIMELKTLLGLNLDEVGLVLRNEDRIAQIRRTYQDERTSDEKRRQLTRECLTLHEDLRATVEAKRAALEAFLADLDVRITRARALLAGQRTPQR
jgi:DNA-binding transcriptional MerR regulator